MFRVFSRMAWGSNPVFHNFIRTNINQNLVVLWIIWSLSDAVYCECDIFCILMDRILPLQRKPMQTWEEHVTTKALDLT